MKYVIPILILALFHAHAAVNPAAASTNYYFTTPMPTASIRGMVMGDPPAYFIPRAEDYAWLDEAFAERVSLRSGSFWWRGTNVLVRIDVSGPSYYREEDWLDGDVPLLEDSRLRPHDTYWHLTNILHYVDYTNVWSNVVSYIEVPLTNGTTSVHTNSWTALRRGRVERTETNVTEYALLDYCQPEGAAMPFPAYTNYPAFADPYGIPSDVGSITNAYRYLRGTVRLADSRSRATNSPPRSTTSRYSYGTAYTNDCYASREAVMPYNWTNTASSVSSNLFTSEWCDYDFARSHRAWKTTALYEEDGEVKGLEVTEHSIYSEESVVSPGTAVFDTRFDSDLVTTGGVTRVAVEAMFVQVLFSYSNYSHTNNDDRVEIFTNVVLRLAGPELDVSGPPAVVRVGLDSRAICEAAASAAGAPPPPSNLSGDPGEERGEFWFTSSDAFEIIYRVTPYTRLSTW